MSVCFWSFDIFICFLSQMKAIFLQDVFLNDLIRSYFRNVHLFIIGFHLSYSTWVCVFEALTFSYAFSTKWKQYFCRMYFLMFWLGAILGMFICLCWHFVWVKSINLFYLEWRLCPRILKYIIGLVSGLCTPFQAYVYFNKATQAD